MTSDTSDYLRDLASRSDDLDAARLSSIADLIDAWDEQDRERMMRTGSSY